MWGWVTGSVARCPMCAVPAQLLAQLEITLGELQGLEQGTGRKSLMRWKAVCPALGGGGKQGTQRLEDNFVCHLPSRPLTSHPWLEILCRKWTFTWWKNYFQPQNFIICLFSKKRWIFISTEKQQMIHFVLAKWKVVYFLILWLNDLLFEWFTWPLWVSTVNHKYYRDFGLSVPIVLRCFDWSDSFIVFLPQWQIIWGKFYAL